jgi:hypothetical protein
MIIDYAHTCSLRVTADRFDVGYRSLHRHIERCLYAILEEHEQRECEQELSAVAAELKLHFEYQLRPRRRKSIITKKVEFTWSRRAWKSKKG